jgi:prophage regulatory protein
MRFLSRKEVKHLVLYTNTHLLRLEAAGSFPKRMRLGNGPRSRVGYADVEIFKWMRSKGFPLPDKTDEDSSE